MYQRRGWCHQALSRSLSRRRMAPLQTSVALLGSLVIRHSSKRPTRRRFRCRRLFHTQCREDLRVYTHNSNLHRWAREWVQTARQAQPRHGLNRHHLHNRRLACLRPEPHGRAPVRQVHLAWLPLQLPGRRQLLPEDHRQGRIFATTHLQLRAPALTAACRHLRLLREDREQKLLGSGMADARWSGSDNDFTLSPISLVGLETIQVLML